MLIVASIFFATLCVMRASSDTLTDLDDRVVDVVGVGQIEDISQTLGVH
jgi:hypothetical protein